ncbi:MAG TPA: hypothetical protein VFG89_10940 [Coriobacteriia bacterium]|nr:hypothetical protein [Coriobacteriia bacterium]
MQGIFDRRAFAVVIACAIALVAVGIAVPVPALHVDSQPSLNAVPTAGSLITTHHGRGPAFARLAACTAGLLVVASSACASATSLLPTAAIRAVRAFTVSKLRI